MNCPAAMMVYNLSPKSYRDLPYKLGEFGTVYRYEKSGELQGLQRVRGFTQNDAHLFCTPEQLKEVINETLDLLDIFYKDVGFDNYKFRLSLSDRENNPDKYAGSPEDWELAESTLREVLKERGLDFEEVVGDAVFYGPKIDVQAINVFGKEDSVSTIQLDFNLPEKFDITYIDSDGEEKQPLIVHRALIGSFERFFSFLIEHHGGDFPLWFTPEQVYVIPISEKHTEYAQKVFDELKEAKEMIKAAIAYLETSFDEKRNGWFAVPKEVNNFPHAFWWHFNEKDNMTIIDSNWGNPSAEILAYLYKYRQYVEKLDIDSLVEYAINYIENKLEFNSDNELFCYIKLYRVLPEALQKRLEKRITSAIEQVIVYDEQEWHEYVPTPIGFVKNIDSNRFGVLESKLNNNLDFIIRELESNGKINPPWGESYYEGDLKEAYNEWIGVLTLKALISLERFERISI